MRQFSETDVSKLRCLVLSYMMTVEGEWGRMEPSGAFFGQILEAWDILGDGPVEPEVDDRFLGVDAAVAKARLDEMRALRAAAEQEPKP